MDATNGGRYFLMYMKGVRFDKTITHTYMPANVCHFSRRDMIQIRLSNCMNAPVGFLFRNQDVVFRYCSLFF